MKKIMWKLFKKHTKEYQTQMALVAACGYEGAFDILERQNKKFVSF